MKAAARWLVVFVITVGLLEGALRLRVWAQKFDPVEQAIKSQMRAIFSDERAAPYVFGHKPNARATLIRGPYRYTFISNADGLRETQNYESLPESVIFLGDSIVEGSSVENDDTMDAVFERLTGIVSLNFGLGAANTIQEYHWLAAKYRPAYHAKVIVLGFCLNDFEQNTYLRYFDPQLGTWRILRHLNLSRGESGSPAAVSDSFRHRVGAYLRRSTAAYALYGLTRRAVAGPVDFYRAEVVTATQRAFTEQHLARIQAFAERAGAALLVVLLPQESQLERDYVPGGRMQDVAIELLNRLRIPYIDMFPVMQAAYRADRSVDWYYDDTHPWKPGHRLIGEHLAREIPQMFPSLAKEHRP